MANEINEEAYRRSEGLQNSQVNNTEMQTMPNPLKFETRKENCLVPQDFLWVLT